jgi:hypothetical protein
MMARGPAARLERAPTFSGQLVKVTAEGEHLTIAFTADTPAALDAAVAAAGAAALTRLRVNNAAVLEAGAHFEERQRQVYANAVAQLRREIGVPEPPPRDEEDVSRADDSAGAVHAPENP